MMKWFFTFFFWDNRSEENCLALQMYPLTVQLKLVVGKYAVCSLLQTKEEKIKSSRGACSCSMLRNQC